jgi:hypothetical protein
LVHFRHAALNFKIALAEFIAGQLEDRNSKVTKGEFLPRLESQARLKIEIERKLKPNFQFELNF